MNNKRNFKSTDKKYRSRVKQPPKHHHPPWATRSHRWPLQIYGHPARRIRDEDAHNMVPKKCICIRLLTCSVADVRRVRFPVALSSIRLHFFEAPKLVVCITRIRLWPAIKTSSTQMSFSVLANSYFEANTYRAIMNSKVSLKYAKQICAS